MKILLDECIPVVMLEHLKSKNLDATHVKETPWAGSSNSDLYKKAQGKYQILITQTVRFWFHLSILLFEEKIEKIIRI